MKTKRISDMEAYILNRGSATMEELRDAFDVSMNTVRRDVAELLKSGNIQKVYGGVRSATQTAVQAAYPKPGGAKRAICFEAAKLVKDGYQAGKAYGQGLMEVATGEKSFSGAMSAATVKTSAEIAKNHASDWAGGGVVGFAAEGTANVTGDGIAATTDSLARGKSLEKALKEGNKAAKQGALNFAVDKTVDLVGGKVGDAVIGEGGGEVVGHLLDSEVTKEGVKEAAGAFAADEIKNSLEDDD